MNILEKDFTQLLPSIQTLNELIKNKNIIEQLQNLEKNIYILENTCIEQGKILCHRDNSFHCNLNLIQKQSLEISNLKYDLYISNKKITHLQSLLQYNNVPQYNHIRRNSI